MTRTPCVPHAWLVATTFLLGACGGTPGPGQSGYAYNVRGVYAGRLQVEEESFDAELELATNLGGRVSGDFRVRRPLEIEGRVEGAIVDDLLRLSVTYRSTGGTDCVGRIDGILTIDRGGIGIDGPATISDCGDPLPGHMSFRR
ncbi:MAG: hypothetical protein ABL963_11130 [Longimicrobiales bacterium]